MDRPRLVRGDRPVLLGASAMLPSMMIMFGNTRPYFHTKFSGTHSRANKCIWKGRHAFPTHWTAALRPGVTGNPPIARGGIQAAAHFVDPFLSNRQYMGSVNGGIYLPTLTSCRPHEGSAKFSTRPSKSATETHRSAIAPFQARGYHWRTAWLDILAGHG